MKTILKSALTILFSLAFISCSFKKENSFSPKIVYKSSRLIITQISENAFEHTSFKKTEDFGNVPCNGLIVRNGSETIVFDTPTDNSGSRELITWLKKNLKCKINAVIPTHFHDDCLGGLNEFHKNNIDSYAYFQTIALAKENDFEVPKKSFQKALALKVGSEKVIAEFFGEGHTRDNIVAYFPSEDIMFGGCLIKEVDANKGYLGDANLKEWSNTVEKIKKEYPNVAIVVPGHGEFGDEKLLDYTIRLFKAP